MFYWIGEYNPYGRPENGTKWHGFYAKDRTEAENSNYLRIDGPFETLVEADEEAARRDAPTADLYCIVAQYPTGITEEGTPISKELAEAWVKDLKNRYPELKHWYRRV